MRNSTHTAMRPARLRSAGILGLFVLLWTTPALALDPSRNTSQYAIETWSSREGLPQNSVYAIVQTCDGYIWLATQEGLVRFDGKTFTIFNHKNTPQMRVNFVMSLFQAKDGALWAGTAGGGVVRFQGTSVTSYTKLEGLSDNWIMSVSQDAQGTLYVGTHGGAHRLRSGRMEKCSPTDCALNHPIERIYADTDGSLWLGTHGRGLLHLQGNQSTEFNMAQGLADSTVSAIYRDRRGDLWVGTGNGVDVLRAGKVAAHYDKKSGLPGNYVSSFLEDRDGNLWMATNNGLVRLHDGRISTMGVAQGLLGRAAACMLEDREGSMWVGTDAGGLNRLQDGKFIPITTLDGLAHNEVGPMCEAPGGVTWVGGFTGGLTRIENGRYTRFTAKDGLPDNMIEALCVDHEGTLWIGTVGGGLVKYRNKHFTVIGLREGLAHRAVMALFERSNHDLWVGTSGGGVNVLRGGKIVEHYTSRDSCGNGFVRYICEDHAGTMWLGSMGGGLTRFRNGDFTNYGPKDGLASDQVACIYEDAEGVLWIGTYGGGLSRLKGGQFTTVNTECGLFDDMVYGIAEDHQGRLWMSCNNGVFCVSRKSLNDYAEHRAGRVVCENFGEADGMREHECNSGQPAVTRMHDGHIWFATLGGVAMLDPDRTPRNRATPPVVLEHVRANLHEIPIKNGISIPPGRGELEVHYAGLSYVSPERVHFRYRLDGFDKAWTDAGTRRDAYYTNLPPGNYNFRVMACNNDGLWNEAGAGFSFRLEPHYYQTWWFLSLLGLLSSLLAHLIYRRRIRGLQSLVVERTLAKEALEGSNSLLEQAMANLQRAQSSLIEQERLRALGQMASGISHDFNNSLAPIMGFSEILLRKPELLDNKPRVLDYLQTIHTASKDAARIVSRLREFYRPRERDEVFPLVSLNTIVEQAVDMTQPKWRGEALAAGVTIDVERNLLEIPRIPGSDSDLRELLTNLIFNAVDAMPDGGRLLIATRPEGSHVCLEVGDSGTGMTEDVRRRCLEPFFSTKGERGTGLGLPMVYGIVQRHHGTVDIKSEPGKGTRFLIHLPVEAQGSPGVDAVQEDQAPPPMRILVVDDEPRVLEFLTSYLEGDQHTVETAADGVEGLKKFYSEPFDLVVMDRAMPRMSGDQLAAAIKKARPETPVILLTGFGELMDARGEKPEGVDLVVSKPVSVVMLRRAMSKLKAA